MTYAMRYDVRAAIVRVVAGLESGDLTRPAAAAELRRLLAPEHPTSEQCPICKWGFWNTRVLAQHIREKHPPAPIRITPPRPD